MSNPFEHFADLPEKLQTEALREGEMRLNAQLAIATAADTRALSWAGLLLTGATAALGGGIALFKSSEPDPWLGFLALGFAGALLWAAWLALTTVAPSLFCLPGNRPGLWLPEEWECTGSEENKIAVARSQQAEQLNKFIRENANKAEALAGTIHRSFRLGIRTLAIFGVILLVTVTYRQFHQEITLLICR